MLRSGLARAGPSLREGQRRLLREPPCEPPASASTRSYPQALKLSAQGGCIAAVLPQNCWGSGPPTELPGRFCNRLPGSTC